jgi:hypothetical protein
VASVADVLNDFALAVELISPALCPAVGDCHAEWSYFAAISLAETCRAVVGVAGTQFACFTGTKVPISLAETYLFCCDKSCRDEPSASIFVILYQQLRQYLYNVSICAFVPGLANASICAFVQKYKCCAAAGTKAQILTRCALS